MSKSPVLYVRAFKLLLFVCLAVSPLVATAQTLDLNNQSQTFGSLGSTTVTLTGRSELHVTGSGDPISGSIINLNSVDAWFFLENVRPSVVNSTFLSRIRVNNAVATPGTNVRVVEYGMGTVVIPHAPSYSPLQVYSGKHFSGASLSLSLYTYYNDTNLGLLTRNISSFRLKRGYMATVAQNANGTGVSKVYVAQDGDLEISLLPDTLDKAINFVRVVPWRWTGKKGWAGGVEAKVNPVWSYDWDNAANSTLDAEYVPMRHNANWNAYSNINNKTNSSHALGFNEPDKSDQANMTVDQAIAAWPNLLASGLRLGAPAPSDAGSGLTWLYDFIDKAKAANLRVDYVPVHFYKGGWTASQLYNWLKAIHDRTGLPVWVTEFNNGANWTDSTNPVTLDGNATVIGQFLDIMNSAPFVERYAVFNWVGDTRMMVRSDGTLTPAGMVYRDKASPLSYIQEIPETPTPAAANYLFEGDVRDSSGNGHIAMHKGLPNFTTGKTGQAVDLNGTSDYVQLSPKLGDSTDFTFGAWIYWTGGSQWQRIFDLGNGTGQYMFLSPRSGSNTLRFAIFKTGTSEQQLNTTQLPANQWVHVAVTISGSTGKLFVNGTLVNTNTSMTLNPSDLATEANFLGKSQFNDPLFAGRLDDVRFLPYALTDAQVAAMPGSRPQFGSDPVVKPGATRLQPYIGSIAGDTSSPNGQVLTYSKVGGPAWLSVAPDGQLIGIPGLSDAGTNVFTVRVTDPTGGAALTTLTIPVTVTPGLVGRYPFDGTPNASVGTGHGVVSGLPIYSAGRYGQALQFDGVDDFVTLPAGVADSSDITIATWVYWDGAGNWERIFDFGNSTSQYLFLSPRSPSGRMRFAIKNGGAEQGIETSSLPSGQWVHVAVTLNGGAGKLYVNGAPVSSAAITIDPSDFRPAINYIGESQWTADPFFKGRIDEFLIYNYALSDTQVAALTRSRAPVFAAESISKPTAPPGQAYRETVAGSATDPDGGDVSYSKVSGPAWLSVAPNGSIFGKPGASDAGLNTFTIRATDSTLLSDDAKLNIVVGAGGNLVADYGFDGNMLDSARSNHATASGAPGYVSGLFDRAVDLDGTAGYVTLPAGVANSSEITIAARVRWDGGAIWQRIFDFGNGTSQYLFLTPRSVSNTLRFGVKNGASEQILETAVLPVGDWTHVAVTLSGGNTGSLYVNGVKVDTRAITLTPSLLNPSVNYIGKSQWAADPLFNGAIDDVKIYDRALSDAEVAGLATSRLTVNPAARMAFDEWAATNTFAAGQDGPDRDPDKDGIPNSWEFLTGSNPLEGDGILLPQVNVTSAKELGLGDSGKTYLTLRARIRKDRNGVALVPQAAATVQGLSDTQSAGNVLQAGGPIGDGAFEVITYYFKTAIQDTPSGSGFIRLNAVVE